MPVYVQHQVLGKIDDVFNAEAIWQAPGLALFARRPLLRDLLERSPREQRGRAPTRCFSHITLMLPQEDVDDDRHLTRGNRARDLADSLRNLHQKDFGDLLGSDDVRYDVVGDERLHPGEIEVRFGHAVYLPAPGEPVLHNVSVSRDSAVWKPVCPVYLDQRLAVLGQEGASVSHEVPGWPFGTECALLLINDGPDKPLEVQARPKNALDCHYDPLSGCHVIRAKDGSNGGASGAHGSPRLFLKLARTTAAGQPKTQVGDPTVEARAKVWKSRTPGAAGIPLTAHAPGMQQSSAPGAGARLAHGTEASFTLAERGADAMPSPAARPGADAAAALGAGTTSVAGRRSASAGASVAGGLSADATAVPVSHRPAATWADAEATYAPVARQRATLVALALPRMSRYRDTGASALSFGFDAALAIATRPADAVLHFSVDAEDRLLAATADGENAIALPASFTPVDARSITALPVPRQMAERYLALVTLPEPRAAAITRGARLSFGRAAPALATLRVLDAAAELRQPAGPASADRLGLSRNAFTFEAGDGVYRIARQSATQALYHLDDQLHFVAAIGDASADAPYLLPTGHHLVAGHYVLRFDA